LVQTKKVRRLVNIHMLEEEQDGGLLTSLYSNSD
jgi:hypothetical protein